MKEEKKYAVLRAVQNRGELYISKSDLMAYLAGLSEVNKSSGEITGFIKDLADQLRRMR